MSTSGAFLCREPPRGSGSLCIGRGVVLGTIEEVLGLRVNPDYFRYLRHKIERTAQMR